jgi:hypothetical protein
MSEHEVAPKSTPSNEHETLDLVTDQQRKSTTASQAPTIGRMTKHRLFQVLIPLASELAIAVVAHVTGIDHEDASAFVHAAHPVVSIAWRRWRARRRRDE